MSPQKKSNRRNFFKSALAAGTTVGLVNPVSANPTSSSGDKIKMLTADGKLVEVDRSVIEKATASKKATNEEVFEWMDKKHKT
jgi:hypothetical protein